MHKNDVHFCSISLEILTILLIQLCEQSLWQSSSECLALDNGVFWSEFEINYKLFLKQYIWIRFSSQLIFQVSLPSAHL